MPQLANMRQLATRQLAHLALIAALVAMICAPDGALGETAPFMTGASSLQANILAWLTPVAIIEGLKDALARLRKFGCRCVLGVQSLSQVTSAYGGEAQAIIENCGNTLILRCSASENGGTSQYASRLIGDREVIRRQRSRGRDNPGGLFAGGARRSLQISDQRLVEPAVLAAQIEQLPDLSGYLKIASSPV